MAGIIKPLQMSSLFCRLKPDDISRTLEQTVFSVTEHQKNSIIALEGDSCTAMGIILEGSVELQKAYPSGKVVTLAQLGCGQVFGEALVFSHIHKYPVTVFARENSKIMLISKESIIMLCSRNPLILQSFLEELSNKILLMNRKIKELSFGTIREKICDFLLHEYNLQKTFQLKLPYSRKKMAESMGVQRPSLSREMCKMQEEGLVVFYRDTVEIKNLEGLESHLM